MILKTDTAPPLLFICAFFYPLLGNHRDFQPVDSFQDSLYLVTNVL